VSFLKFYPFRAVPYRLYNGKLMGLHLSSIYLFYFLVRIGNHTWGKRNQQLAYYWGIFQFFHIHTVGNIGFQEPKIPLPLWQSATLNDTFQKIPTVNLGSSFSLFSPGKYKQAAQPLLRASALPD